MIKYMSFFDINDPEVIDYKSVLESKPMKIYTDFKNGDGSYICHPVWEVRRRNLSSPTDFDLMYKDARAEFESSLKPFEVVKQDLRLEGIKEILRRNIEERKAMDEEFAEKLNEFKLDEFCDKKNKNDLANIRAKKKRFLRKCAFNRDKLNWFGTITWDGSKLETAKEWMETLLRWLGNNAYRYGAKIMGAFEYGEENGRIHFHCVAALPEDFFTDMYTVHRWSEKDRKYMNFLESKEIREKFGMNDWERLDNMAEDSFLRTLKYVCKYAAKEGGRMYYSRGLPDCTYQRIDSEDLFFVFDDGGVTKYKLCDGFRFKSETILGVLRSAGALDLDTPLPFRAKAV